MPAIELTSSQRRLHRAAAHHLDAVVIVGADGLTTAVRREIDVALKAHELVKIRMLSDDRQARNSALEELAQSLSAAPVQHIGKLLVLWRPAPPQPKAEADGRRPGPREVKILKFSKSGNHRPQVKKIRLMGNERVTAGGLVKRSRNRKASPKKSRQT